MNLAVLSHSNFRNRTMWYTAKFNMGYKIHVWMVSLPVSGTHSFNMQETKLLVVYYTEVWILTSSSDILQLQLSKRLFTQQILSRIHIVNTLSNAVYYISDNFLSWDRYPSRQTTLIQRRNMVEASTLNNGRHFDVEPMLSV